MDQYAIYLRKSRDDDDSQGDAVERHRKTLLELAAARGYVIGKIYNEDVMSGDTIRDRPKMQELLRDIEAGLWRGVLVMEVPRLARGDTVDQGIVARAMRYSDTQVITPMRVYDTINETDEEYLEFELFMSRREYKMINRRQQAGRLASVKEGKFVAHKTAFGYRRIKIPNGKGFMLEPVPEEAKIVQLIFDLYTIGIDGERLGCGKIAQRLNNMGIPTRTGNEWTLSTIRDMVTNPVYIGKIRWNWRPATKEISDGQITESRNRNKQPQLYEGLHDAIIDEETFTAAQQCLAKNPARPIGERYKVTNPLAGLIICGVCGRRMTRRPYATGKTPDTLLCQGINCNNISSYLSIVEDHLLDALRASLNGYRMEWRQHKDDYRQQQKLDIVFNRSISAAAADISALKEQLEKVYNLLETGVYDLVTFNTRCEAIKAKIAATEKRITAINEAQSTENQALRQIEMIIPKMEHVLEVYRTLPDAKSKNDLLKEVLEKAVYTKTKKCGLHGDKNDFELVIYPRLFY